MIHPYLLSRFYPPKEGQEFEVVLALSSLENLGFGQFGEGLHPWEDMVVLARAWCLAANEAQLLVALPNGDDHIVFNSHK